MTYILIKKVQDHEYVGFWSENCTQLYPLKKFMILFLFIIFHINKIPNNLCALNTLKCCDEANGSGSWTINHSVDLPVHWYNH